jgi:hypothetical protein
LLPWPQLSYLQTSPMTDDQKSPILGFSWPELLASAIRFAQKRPRCAELAFGSGSVLGLRFSVQRFFWFFVVIFFGSSSVELNFRQLKCRTELPQGVYKWLLAPGRWPFWCFWGCFVAKNPSTPTQERGCVRGAMTKPVAVFRSGVI